MDGLVFVDTNLLIYARDASDPEKQAAADAWMTRLWESGRGRLGLQVLHEFYVAVTRDLKPGLPPEEAREDVWALRAWEPLSTDLELVEAAWELEDRYGLTFRDALVVSAARRLGCTTLLSDGFRDGRHMAGVTVVDPFRHPPDPPAEPS